MNRRPQNLRRRLHIYLAEAAGFHAAADVAAKIIERPVWRVSASPARIRAHDEREMVVIRMAQAEVDVRVQSAT